MGQPSIIIQFQTAAADSISLLSKGVVGLILRDENSTGAYSITSADEIPEGLSESNRGYIQRALIGSVNRPRKVLAYVLGGTTETPEDIKNALQYFASQTVDYLCAPPEGESADVAALVEWVKKQREDQRI